VRDAVGDPIVRIQSAEEVGDAGGRALTTTGGMVVVVTDRKIVLPTRRKASSALKGVHPVVGSTLPLT